MGIIKSSNYVKGGASNIFVDNIGPWSQKSGEQLLLMLVAPS